MRAKQRKNTKIVDAPRKKQIEEVDGYARGALRILCKYIAQHLRRVSALTC